MLPGQDGFEVLNQLRAEPRTAEVPVIVVSSKSQPADKQTATKIGANAYLTKPYKRAELLSLIRSLLNEASKSKKEFAQGSGVILVGAHGRKEARVAVNVGLALVNRGEKVTIVDFRPFSVEHSHLLGVSPCRETISLSDSETLEHLQSLVTPHSDRLHLLNNLEGGGKAGQLTSEDVQSVLEVLLAEDGIILADLPLYPAQVLRQAADLCNRVILVSPSDKASLAAAHAALTQMDQAGVEENKTGIVLLGREAEGEDRPEFGPEVLGSIPAEADSDDPAFHALAKRLVT
jgi:hypothetical protein